MSSLHKVRPGQPLEIPATDYNAMIDAARAHAQGQGQGLMGQANAPAIDQRIRVRNDTDQTVPRFGILAAGGFALTASLSAMVNQILIKGLKPTADTVDWVVVQEPLAPGEVGVCINRGLTICRLSTTSSGPPAQEYVRTVADTVTHARTHPWGQAKVHESTTTVGGARYGLIDMGQTPSIRVGLYWMPPINVDYYMVRPLDHAGEPIQSVQIPVAVPPKLLFDADQYHGITSATPYAVGGLGRAMQVSDGSNQETWTEHPRMSQGDLVLYAPVQYTGVLDAFGDPVMYQEISNRGWRVVL